MTVALREVPDRQMSEAQFQSEILKLARLNGWLAYHTHDSRRSPEGYPDLTLAHPDGLLIFAEIKTERGKTTPAQDAWLAVLGAAAETTAFFGGFAAPVVRVFLWRPSDWDRIERTLTRRVA